MKRLIIGITGASGIVYGQRLLEVLSDIPDIETHLIVTKAGEQTRHYELDITSKALHQLADHCYAIQDITADIASGSFKTMGMVIAPCSMGTLSEIANSLNSNLLTRAADVILKERRKLVLLPRETPLNLVHLENMVKVTQMGGIIAPPMPAFYARPKTLDDLVNHSIGRILDLLDIEAQGLFTRWDEARQDKK